MRRPVDLNDVEAWLRETQEVAKPHRTPDFSYIRKACKGRPLTVKKVSGPVVEESDTGYDGILFRYELMVGDVTFQVDLLPDHILNLAYAA